jgi:prefoldin subunit 5
VAQQQEIDLLRNQARSLKEQLEAVEKRIGELEGAGQSQ